MNRQDAGLLAGSRRVAAWGIMCAVSAVCAVSPPCKRRLVFQRTDKTPSTSGLPSPQEPKTLLRLPAGDSDKSLCFMKVLKILHLFLPLLVPSPESSHFPALPFVRVFTTIRHRRRSIPCREGRLSYYAIRLPSMATDTKRCGKTGVELPRQLCRSGKSCWPGVWEASARPLAG